MLFHFTAYFIRLKAFLAVSFKTHENTLTNWQNVNGATMTKAKKKKRNTCVNCLSVCLLTGRWASQKNKWNAYSLARTQWQRQHQQNKDKWFYFIFCSVSFDPKNDKRKKAIGNSRWFCARLSHFGSNDSIFCFWSRSDRSSQNDGQLFCSLFGRFFAFIAATVESIQFIFRLLICVNICFTIWPPTKTTEPCKNPDNKITIAFLISANIKVHTPKPCRCREM